MKRTNKKQYQKTIASILAVIIVIALVLGLAAPFLAAETNNGITIDAKVGFEQNYKIGAYTPFSIFLKNDGRNFKGELQLKIFLNPSNNENHYSIYYQDVDLPQGSAKELNFNIIIPSIQDNIEIALVDDKEIVVSQEFKLSYYQNGSLLAAVLTDDKNNMNVLKNLKVRNDNLDKNVKQTQNAIDSRISLNNNLIFMDEISFPKSKMVLNNFEVLIINNYDTTLLSSEQTNALKQWLNSGGTLIIGTGQYKDKVLKGLESIVDINNIDRKVDIDISGVNQSTSIISAEEGKILIHDFDLSLGSEVTNTSIDTLSYLYNQFISSNYNDDNLYIENGNLNNILTDNDNVLTKFMIIILFIYIIIVGPVLYIYLKKKDKLDKAWIIMPCTACITTIIIFALSFLTPYKNIFINNISILKFKNDNKVADIDTTLGVIIPKDTAELKFNKNITIPTSNRGYYNDPNIDYRENIMYKISLDETNSIKINKPLLENLNNMFTSTSKDFSGNIDISVYFNDSKIKFNVTNNTGHNLEDCILVLGHVYAYCEQLENNSSREFELVITDNLAFNSSSMLQDIFGNIYDFREIKEKVDTGLLTKQKVKINMRRYLILHDVLRNTLGLEYSSDLTIRFFAFNNDNITDLSITSNNKKVNMFNENIFFVEKDIALEEGKEFDIPKDIALEEGKEFDIPKGIINVSNIYTNDFQNAYDKITSYSEQNEIYINDEAVINFDFKLPNDITLDKFRIYWEAQSYLGTMQVYNVNKNTWEDINTTDEEITKSNGEIYDLYNQEFIGSDYVNQDNIITVRVASEGYVSMQLPNISIKGNK